MGQCEPGLACVLPSTGGYCGRCRATAALDQPCKTSAVEYGPICASGLYCDYGNWHCVAAKTDGAACNDDSHCLSGWCSEQRCKAPLPRNAACSFGDRCAHQLFCRDGICSDRPAENESCLTECLPGSVCVDGICKRVAVCPQAAAGESCALIGCADGAYCEARSWTCRPTIALNGACDESSYSEQCGPHAYCSFTDSVCAAYPGVGESCETARCDFGTSYCDTSRNPATCTAYRAVGAACEFANQCASGFCDADRTCVASCDPG
jgi:hypothetical protein